MLYTILLDIWQSFQQWKNFENRLRFDEIIVTRGAFWDKIPPLSTSHEV